VVRSIFHLEGDLGPLAIANLLHEFKNISTMLAYENSQAVAIAPEQEPPEVKVQLPEQPQQAVPDEDGGEIAPVLAQPEMGPVDVAVPGVAAQPVMASYGVIDLSRVQAPIAQQEYEEIKTQYGQIFDSHGWVQFASFTDPTKFYRLAFPPLRPDVEPNLVWQGDHATHDFPVCSCPAYKYGNYNWQNARRQRRNGGCKHVRMFLNVLEVPFENFHWHNKDEAVHDNMANLVNGFFGE
jgi:hypothetical protein